MPYQPRKGSTWSKVSMSCLSPCFPLEQSERYTRLAKHLLLVSTVKNKQYFVELSLFNSVLI